MSELVYASGLSEALLLCGLLGVRGRLQSDLSPYPCRLFGSPFVLWKKELVLNLVSLLTRFLLFLPSGPTFSCYLVCSLKHEIWRAWRLCWSARLIILIRPGRISLCVLYGGLPLLRLSTVAQVDLLCPLLPRTRLLPSLNAQGRNCSLQGLTNNPWQTLAKRRRPLRPWRAFFFNTVLLAVMWCCPKAALTVGNSEHHSADTKTRSSCLQISTFTTNYLQLLPLQLFSARHMILLSRTRWCASFVAFYDVWIDLPEFTKPGPED